MNYLHCLLSDIFFAICCCGITLLGIRCYELYKYFQQLKINKRPEHILCAAIHYDDGKKYAHQPKNIHTGYVVCGRRHHNCISIASDLLGENYNRNFANRDNQGFLTSEDRFVNRKEAFDIAVKSKQLINPALYQPGKKKILTSEDIY